MVFLRSVAYDPRAATHDRFPFNLPVLAGGCRLNFEHAVTVFVGENGSGKSTLVEALALAIGLPAIGAADVRDDPTLQAQKQLADVLQLVWQRKTRRGFFLRAEDFFNFCKRLRALREEFLQQLQLVDEQYAEKSSYSRALAKLPYLRSLAEMEALYGQDLDAMSHGESFLKFFSSRLRSGGLFLLDEPEAPLSPVRQLALIRMIRECETAGAQFIIATHSPLLMAYPGATLYSLDHGQINRVTWDHLEHVTLLRDFLNHPDAFLRRL